MVNKIRGLIDGSTSLFSKGAATAYKLSVVFHTAQLVTQRTVFPLDPRAKKLLLALFVKTYSQFSLSLKILIQKLQINTVSQGFPNFFASSLLSL
jgi:hypothetical protein